MLILPREPSLSIPRELPALALALLVLALAGCSPSSPGERLYRRHCSSCHGPDGGGGVRYLADEGANLLDGTWKYGSDSSSIEYSILNEEVRDHPTWEFTNTERQQLVEHVLALRGETR